MLVPGHIYIVSNDDLLASKETTTYLSLYVLERPIYGINFTEFEKLQTINHRDSSRLLSQSYVDKGNNLFDYGTVAHHGRLMSLPVPATCKHSEIAASKVKSFHVWGECH